MYACNCETAADFSKGCAGKRISLSLFATHPHRLSIRELISTHLEIALIGTWARHVPISSRSCLERHRSSSTAGKRSMVPQDRPHQRHSIGTSGKFPPQDEKRIMDSTH